MEIKLVCGYCGVRNKSFAPPVQGTFNWKCPMCMREWTHIGEEPKLTFKKKIVKVAKATKKVEIIKEVEFKPDFELGD